MYIRRHMEKTLNRASSMFGAILVTGARQVGKTTMLQRVETDIPYVTLDDPIMLKTAAEDGGLFFKTNPPPVFIDEIQYAPGLFPYMKLHLDKTREKGQFFLSGSQQFKLQKNISESLAGRIGILNLLGLSMRELNAVDFSEAFLPTDEYFSKRRESATLTDYKSVWRLIHRGSMPEVCVNQEIDWQMFYASYTKTYIERDVRELTQVGDEVKFINFLTAIASVTGQLLNLASVARDVGISQPTADRWLSILRASNIVYLLQPFYNNIAKRAMKTPKVYFLDTGLAAYLTRWATAETLEYGAMSGAFFETFIISEILKSYYNEGILEPPLYFYRDKEQNEIDLLIQRGNTLYPIEIKKHATPSRDDIKSFRVLKKLGNIEIGSGGVMCLYDNLINLNEQNRAIPMSYI